MNNEPLLTLVSKLRNCPSHDASISRELFLECWNDLLHEEVDHLIKPTAPIMAALILNDVRFTPLLNEAEQVQLQTLVNLAIDRYEQKNNPPNKLGKLIAGSIKKESI